MKICPKLKRDAGFLKQQTNMTYTLTVHDCVGTDINIVDIDPPADTICVDRNKNTLEVGNMVRVCATGTVMKVQSIVYLGFEDRSLVEEFNEPGFMISPNENGSELVNAGDVVIIYNYYLFR